ncbi:MAG: hypothetical protein ACT4PN_05435 [Nitrospiraceae bacterium]
MKSQAIVRAAIATAMLLPVGFVTIGSAQDLDRDRDQLKTQQQGTSCRPKTNSKPRIS